jgi:hypothetical protein
VIDFQLVLRKTLHLHSPFSMGETTSHASFVISQSSVRGLSDACMALLESLIGDMLIGAKASVQLASNAAIATGSKTMFIILRSRIDFRITVIWMGLCHGWWAVGSLASGSFS